MELEILRLIYDYSVHGKFIDANLIEQIISTIVSQRDLAQYVRNVEFIHGVDIEDDMITYASYNPFTMMIKINCDALRSSLDDKSCYDHLFDGVEQPMFKNFLITQYVLHELEHAYQNRQSQDQEDHSLETTLINASMKLEKMMRDPKILNAIQTDPNFAHDMKDYALYTKQLYQRYYVINPAERLAQIRSFRTIVTALEPIKKHVPRLYEFENASLLEELLQGYEESYDLGICPTQVYLQGNDQSEVWSQLDFYHPNEQQLRENVHRQYTLNKRLTLGLPVSPKEYELLYNHLQTTNKYQA